MGWDWAIETFKGLIVAALTWIAIYLRKHAKTFLKDVKRFAKIVDTTEELRSEVAIEKSKRLAMNDILIDPFFTTNEKMEVDWANAAYAKMCGVSDPRDLHGFGYLALIAPEDQDRIQDMVDRLKLHPSSTSWKAKYFNQDTGDEVLTECRMALFYGADGKLMGSVGRIYIIKP